MRKKDPDSFISLSVHGTSIQVIINFENPLRIGDFEDGIADKSSEFRRLYPKDLNDDIEKIFAEEYGGNPRRPKYPEYNSRGLHEDKEGSRYLEMKKELADMALGWEAVLYSYLMAEVDKIEKRQEADFQRAKKRVEAKFGKAQ